MTPEELRAAEDHMDRLVFHLDRARAYAVLLQKPELSLTLLDLQARVESGCDGFRFTPDEEEAVRRIYEGK
jgi:hypothetical protein